MQKKVAIIGGGMTGLVCAYELSKRGYAVTVFESGSTVGGLVAGFAINGTSLEKAYHHLFTTDEAIINLTIKLGIEEKLIWQPSSIAVYFGGKFYPFSGALDLLRFTPLALWDRLRVGLSLFYLQKTSKWEGFKKLRASEWIRKWGGERAYQVIWEPLLKGKFHQFYHDVSMAWLWARINTRGNSRKSLLEKEKLGYFKGGFQVLVDKLVSEIEKVGGEIKTATQVAAIKEHGEKVIVEASSGRHEFDYVIATVPSHVFAKLIAHNPEIDPDYLKRLESISYLGALCYVFSTPQSLSSYYWHNITDEQSPFLVFIQHTNFIDKSEYQGEHVYYIGTYLPHEHEFFKMSKVEIETLFFGHLKKIFSHFDATLLKTKQLFMLKNAQHVVDLDYEQKIPPYETPLKNVYLANFSQIFPEDRGTNYSVREAYKIVELIDGKS